jgi:hypothetical protein
VPETLRRGEPVPVGQTVAALLADFHQRAKPPALPPRGHGPFAASAPPAHAAEEPCHEPPCKERPHPHQDRATSALGPRKSAMPGGASDGTAERCAESKQKRPRSGGPPSASPGAAGRA